MVEVFKTNVTDHEYRRTRRDVERIISIKIGNGAHIGTFDNNGCAVDRFAGFGVGNFPAKGGLGH